MDQTLALYALALGLGSLLLPRVKRRLDFRAPSIARWRDTRAWPNGWHA